MGRLKSALKSRYAEREENINIYTPKNCEIVKLHFRGEKMAKVCEEGSICNVIVRCVVKYTFLLSCLLIVASYLIHSMPIDYRYLGIKIPDREPDSYWHPRV